MELVRLLLQCGAKVDYRKTLDDDFPRTHLCDEPLRLAIRNKHMDVARLLLENGADPNKRYFFGSEINLINDLDFLQLLLTFGADPDSRDRSGLTPLMKASRQVHVCTYYYINLFLFLTIISNFCLNFCFVFPGITKCSFIVEIWSRC